MGPALLGFSRGERERAQPGAWGCRSEVAGKVNVATWDRELLSMSEVQGGAKEDVKGIVLRWGRTLSSQFAAGPNNGGKEGNEARI